MLSSQLHSPGRRSLIYWRMPQALVNALWAFAQIRFALRALGSDSLRSSNRWRLAVGLDPFFRFGFAPLSELLDSLGVEVQIRSAL